MRSFAFILIAAALATFGSAAPTGGAPPVKGDRLDLSSPPEDANGFTLISILFNHDLGHSVVGSKNAGAASSILSEVQTRSTTPSIDDIFANLFDSSGPSIDELGSLGPSDITDVAVSELVSAIQADIEQAIALLGNLDGMARHDGIDHNSLTDTQLAQKIAVYVNSVLEAVGRILDSDVNLAIKRRQIRGTLYELGGLVDELVSTALSLVPGLNAALASLLAPVKSVVNELGLRVLGGILGLWISGV